MAPPPIWLIHRVLVAHSFGILYGYRGLGKSHIALDLAYRVAMGQRWFGQRTRIGNVIYVMAGEGLYGLGIRLRAWEEYNETQVESDAIRYLTTPVILTEPTQIKRFVKAIRAIHFDPSLIIFDTLARCAPGIVENAYEGMSGVVRGVDEIRAETGAAVLLVHHSGKPDDEGRTHLRGHSALESAADTIIHLDGAPLGLHCEKQKEAPDFHSIYFELEPVGESCVPVRVERAQESKDSQIGPAEGGGRKRRRLY